MTAVSTSSPTPPSGASALTDDPLNEQPVVRPSSLSSAPNDEELYWYFGPQRRWLLWLLTIAFIGPTLALFVFFWSPGLVTWMMVGMLAVFSGKQVLAVVDSMRTRRYSRRSHELLVRAWRPAQPMSVDIFLPTCGEPLDILANAYAEVAKITWDGPLTAWVLDDADRPGVRELAESCGFRYVVRPDRGHLKKAGNLNHALSISTGDMILILDADFCPRADIIRHLAPYMESSDVGIVQSPAVYETERETWLERSAASSQEWFNRWIQPARDAGDAAICCGTNALYRRSALETMDGFAKLEHSEDMFTGLGLQARGFRTVYLPLTLAKGLSPDTMAAFINQQYRWASGHMLLIRMGRKAFQGLASTFPMRLHFFSGLMGYMFTMLNSMLTVLPPVIIMYAAPEQVQRWQVVAMAPTLWMYLVVLPSAFKVRWRVEALRGTFVVGYSAAASLIHVLGDRMAAWVPTGASHRSSPLPRQLSTIMLLWLGGTTLAVWFGVARGIVEYGFVEYIGMLGYAVFISYLLGPLCWHLWGVLFPTGRAPRSKMPTTPNNPGWAMNVAVTIAIGLAALLASGWVDPMLS